jgi:hypothetical protein
MLTMLEIKGWETFSIRRKKNTCGSGSRPTLFFSADPGIPILQISQYSALVSNSIKHLSVLCYGFTFHGIETMFCKFIPVILIYSCCLPGAS